MENPVLNGLQVKRQKNNSESSLAMVNGDVSTEEESMDVDDSIGDISTGYVLIDQFRHKFDSHSEHLHLMMLLR